jgi:hypothetical protein
MDADAFDNRRGLHVTLLGAISDMNVANVLPFDAKAAGRYFFYELMDDILALGFIHHSLARILEVPHYIVKTISHVLLADNLFYQVVKRKCDRRFHCLQVYLDVPAFCLCRVAEARTPRPYRGDTSPWQWND